MKGSITVSGDQLGAALMALAALFKAQKQTKKGTKK